MFAEYPLPLNLMFSEKASVSNLETMTANLKCEVFVDILSPSLLMHGIMAQRKPQTIPSTSFPLAHFHQSCYQFISCFDGGAGEKKPEVDYECNQQDATTQVNLLFLVSSVCFGRCFRPSSLCILILCVCLTTLTEVFPCFFLSCKANARVKPAKTGHGPHSS
jgi:hypothetical protein